MKCVERGFGAMRRKRDMSYDEAYRIITKKAFDSNVDGVIDGNEEYRAVAKAVTACEKQIPMSPVERDVNGKKVKCCYDCGTPVEFSNKYGLKRFNFCPKCGRKISWLISQDSIVMTTCDTFRRKMSPSIEALSKIAETVVKTIDDEIPLRESIHEIKTALEKSEDIIVTKGRLDIIANEITKEITAQLDNENE